MFVSVLTSIQSENINRNDQIVTMTAKEVQNQLRRIADEKIALHSRKYFKTGVNQYGEGDQFLGIRVPEQRRIARQYKKLTLTEAASLLRSDFHEERLTALFILEHQFSVASAKQKKIIYDIYLKNSDVINNWDLIDSSAPNILGAWLYDKPRDILHVMADSDNLWHRRMAIMATYYFIKQGDFTDTLQIANTLLNDHHHLIHKAVGWMLREIGKRNLIVLEEFLISRYREMPRIMLRYAVEKLPEDNRQAYLKGTL